MSGGLSSMGKERTRKKNNRRGVGHVQRATQRWSGPYLQRSPALHTFENEYRIAGARSPHSCIHGEMGGKVGKGSRKFREVKGLMKMAPLSARWGGTLLGFSGGFPRICTDIFDMVLRRQGHIAGETNHSSIQMRARGGAMT